jgi:hypothetical protein
MSIAANVLHAWLPAKHEPVGWSPGVAPQIGAAVWPIGLMLAVEALSRIRWPKGIGWGLARFGGAGAVAAGSAILSTELAMLAFGGASSPAHLRQLRFQLGRITPYVIGVRLQSERDRSNDSCGIEAAGWTSAASAERRTDSLMSVMRRLLDHMPAIQSDPPSHEMSG